MLKNRLAAHSVISGIAALVGIILMTVCFLIYLGQANSPRDDGWMLGMISGALLTGGGLISSAIAMIAMLSAGKR